MMQSTLLYAAVTQLNAHYADAVMQRDANRYAAC
jgi:hypothetical protein